jgi:hypothetical protein
MRASDFPRHILLSIEGFFGIKERYVHFFEVDVQFITNQSSKPKALFSSKNYIIARNLPAKRYINANL